MTRGRSVYELNQIFPHYDLMSGATPTLLPRELDFPFLLPKPPQPHLIPLSKRRVYTHINAFRDLQREMDDLSDEENELEDLASLFQEKHSFSNVFFPPSRT
jgi:hypothetical protein